MARGRAEGVGITAPETFAKTVTTQLVRGKRQRQARIRLLSHNRSSRQFEILKEKRGPQVSLLLALGFAAS